ncbi:hypothetical protein S1361_21850 [Streptomyces cyanogenus]|uniref:Uncharacterized protein n=1 Tax=Streptomyces cyanogenus TaxID=80860 RepID=A0ABX7TTG7_STRCY|nr:hypothetical protein S1361_21850 [Streptomyces cyanogenus]
MRRGRPHPPREDVGRRTSPVVAARLRDHGPRGTRTEPLRPTAPGRSHPSQGAMRRAGGHFPTAPANRRSRPERRPRAATRPAIQFKVALDGGRRAVYTRPSGSSPGGSRQDDCAASRGLRASSTWLFSSSFPRTASSSPSSSPTTLTRTGPSAARTIERVLWASRQRRWGSSETGRPRSTWFRCPAGFAQRIFVAKELFRLALELFGFYALRARQRKFRVSVGSHCGSRWVSMPCGLHVSGNSGPACSASW